MPPGVPPPYPMAMYRAPRPRGVSGVPRAAPLPDALPYGGRMFRPVRAPNSSQELGVRVNPALQWMMGESHDSQYDSQWQEYYQSTGYPTHAPPPAMPKNQSKLERD